MRDYYNRPLQTCKKYLELTKGNYETDEEWIEAAHDKLRYDCQAIIRK